MYNTNKSLSIRSFIVSFTLLVFTVFTSPIFADENYGNIIPDANVVMSMSSLESVDLPFDPNDYNFLIYVPNPGGQEDSIRDAMDHLEIPYDWRDYSNPVTPEDLATHDILIVGWNAAGDTSGLDDDILAAGITGRVILSGHDLDYHTVQGLPAAEVFLVQAIDWVLKGGGTGMITLGCTNGFSYLPGAWGVDANFNEGEDITEFTAYGLYSGVYDGLEPNNMDNWRTSYHDIFTVEQGSSFVPFELGGNLGRDIITIASNKFKFPYFNLYKDDNIPDGNCVLPDVYITYSISYDANGYGDSNVIIVDHLPQEVDYNSSSGDYNEVNRTVSWNLGTVSPDANGTFTLTVRVNVLAEPLGKIRNYCEIESDRYYNFAVVDTNIGSWNPPVIYVDDNASGSNTGMSWGNAYSDLQDALARARAGLGSQIWVAAGIYPNSSVTFQLVNDVPIYGGFPSGGGQRDWVTNETILDGLNAVTNVVTANGIEDATLDGFTIKGGCGWNFGEICLILRGNMV